MAPLETYRTTNDGDEPRSPHEDFIDDYIESMPFLYRHAFDENAMEAHAAIVQRRGERATRVEIWRELPERVVAICVVADDCPGLLALVSAALHAQDLDVIAAQAYCRERPDGAVEAVDLFWIRRVPTVSRAPIHARDVARLGELLDASVRGRGM